MVYNEDISKFLGGSMNKIIKIAILLIIIIFSISSNILAVSETFSQAEGFIETGKNNVGTTINTTSLQDASGTIYNIFLGIGVAVAVIVGAILGIQFMTAGVDKKVEVKEALVPYVISCIVVFGSFGIWKLVVTVLNSVT